MITALLVALAFIVQWCLGWPGAPPELSLLVVPMVWLVRPALLHREHTWPVLPLVIGLVWDLFLERLIGPGGIAWTAAAFVCYWVASIVADRSPKAWFALGAISTVVVSVTRELTLLPLGAASPLQWLDLALGALMTGAWCALVGWVGGLGLPARWNRLRARRLR